MENMQARLVPLWQPAERFDVSCTSYGNSFLSHRLWLTGGPSLQTVHFCHVSTDATELSVCLC